MREAGKIVVRRASRQLLKECMAPLSSHSPDIILGIVYVLLPLCFYGNFLLKMPQTSRKPRLQLPQQQKKKQQQQQPQQKPKANQARNRPSVQRKKSNFSLAPASRMHLDETKTWVPQPDDEMIKRMTPASRAFLLHFLWPEKYPPVRFPDSVISQVSLNPYVYEQEIPMVAGSCGVYIRADIFRLLQTYTDDAGTGLANVNHPEAATIASIYSTARCTSMCVKFKVKSATTARTGTVVVTPVRRADIDFIAVPASTAAHISKHGAVKLDATPVELFCVRACPENAGILASFGLVTGIRDVPQTWGTYISASGYQAGDSLSISVFYTFECRVKSGVKMVPSSVSTATGDSEMIIPAATSGAYPFVRSIGYA